MTHIFETIAAEMGKRGWKITTDPSGFNHGGYPFFVHPDTGEEFTGGWEKALQAQAAREEAPLPSLARLVEVADEAQNS